MINIKLAYLLLIISIIALIFSVVFGFLDGRFNYFGIITNLLLIISMVYNIYAIKKNKN
jgi:hypothetical protein